MGSVQKKSWFSALSASILLVGSRESNNSIFSLLKMSKLSTPGYISSEMAHNIELQCSTVCNAQELLRRSMPEGDDMVGVSGGVALLGL
jgi:hypothetical protein